MRNLPLPDGLVGALGEEAAAEAEASAGGSAAASGGRATAPIRVAGGVSAR
jgi:hypothetical protein